MKKLKRKKHRNKHKRHRNAAGGASTTRGFRMPRISRGAPPPWKTIGAAVAGSVGSAIASGLIVNQKIAKPETISLLMTATGGLGAYLTDGNTRVAFTGVAAAGAGQYALAALGKAAMRKEAERQQQAPAAQAAQLPAAQTAPAPAPRQRATGGGAVVELFRDAASELEDVDDDAWRYRDDAGDDETPLEIDLDEAA